MILSTGCATTTPAPAPVQTWQLANADPVTLQPLARARISYDRPLPPHLTQKLSDEFHLVTITRPADWQEVRQRLHLSGPTTAVDLSKGTIIGILADIGESSQSDWPIQFQTVRARAGLGAIEANFSPGLYYPIKSAAYLELAYVPGLRTVCTVRISHRTFVIRSPATVY